MYILWLQRIRRMQQWAIHGDENMLNIGLGNNRGLSLVWPMRSCWTRLICKWHKFLGYIYQWRERDRKQWALLRNGDRPKSFDTNMNSTNNTWLFHLGYPDDDYIFHVFHRSQQYGVKYIWPLSISISILMMSTCLWMETIQMRENKKE